MSYANLIDRNLARAFNQLKDLAVDITLNRVASADFNFGTGQVTKTEATVVIKAVILDASRRSQEHSGVKKLVMFKQKDLGSLKGYDSFTHGGKLWKLGDVLKSDGFIAMVEVS